MRVSLLYLLFVVLWAITSWTTLSGALFFVSLAFLFVFLIISMCYSSISVLFFLGARELRSGDAKALFEASSQEAYKLGIKTPRLFFYNGSLERAFVLENRRDVSLVLDKTLIDSSTKEELKAICFELLLQVKKKMARKRTKVMFFIGMISWLVHSVSKIILLILPGESLKRSFSAVVMFLMAPLFSALFKLTIGKDYFKRISVLLEDFPKEFDDLNRIGHKIRKDGSYHSLSSRKILELASVYKSKNFQSIMLLEFLPHEWDYFFSSKDDLC